MLKEYIVILTLLISALGFNENTIASQTPSSSGSSTTLITPSTFQQNGAVIPVLETGAQNYIQTIETNELNYGLHLINLDGSTVTNPQVQFITDYSRMSCNANTTESNLQECQDTPGSPPYATLRPSSIFNFLSYTDSNAATSMFVTRNLINPFPDSQLNTLLNTKASATKSDNQTQIASLIAAQTPIIMAQNSLNGIIARRYIDPETTKLLTTSTSTYSPPSNYTPTSIMQTMHDESLRRISDPAWFNTLNNLSGTAPATTNQLLMELLQLEAFKLWMDYNKIQQNERLEALLAALLSAQAASSNAISGMMDQDTKNAMSSSKSQMNSIKSNLPQTINGVNITPPSGGGS